MRPAAAGSSVTADPGSACAIGPSEQQLDPARLWIRCGRVVSPTGAEGATLALRPDQLGAGKNTRMSPLRALPRVTGSFLLSYVRERRMGVAPFLYRSPLQKDETLL